MKTLSLLALFSVFISCQAQSQKERIVGGPCEGCEALLEYGNQKLDPVDTLPGFEENEPKLHLSGIVFEKDGKTPAKDVIIYAYHTDKKGIYAKEDNPKGWGSRHGMYRGWVKTDADGRYDFYTFRPASYPNTTVNQHIHMTVKEPNTIPYYIDDIEFTDDPFMTEEKKENQRNRGGSGIVTPAQTFTGTLTEIRRDIILGKNIPGY